MIVQTPNPVLNTPAQRIKKIDKKVLQIISLMKKVLSDADNPKGVGLAAPQIGVPLAIFITRPKEKSPIDVFLNPEITWRSENLAEINREENGQKTKQHEKKLEGCLSIHNVWGHLKRPDRIRLKYISIEGVMEEKEFTGFMATIIQHETDHINGILFTQRVLEQKEKLFRIEYDAKGEEKLEEIEI